MALAAAARVAHTKEEREPMRLPIIWAAVALVLAGCNANQSPNASVQQPAYVSNYQIQDPIHQAQTTGFYAGR